MKLAQGEGETGGGKGEKGRVVNSWGRETKNIGIIARIIKIVVSQNRILLRLVLVQETLTPLLPPSQT